VRAARLIPNDASVALSLYAEALGSTRPVRFGLYSFDTLLKLSLLDHFHDGEMGLRERVLHSVTSESEAAELVALNQDEVMKQYAESIGPVGSIESYYRAKGSPVGTIFRQACEWAQTGDRKLSFELGQLWGAIISIDDDIADLAADQKAGRYNPVDHDQAGVERLREKFAHRVRDILRRMKFANEDVGNLFKKIGLYSIALSPTMTSSGGRNGLFCDICCGVFCALCAFYAFCYEEGEHKKIESELEEIKKELKELKEEVKGGSQDEPT
jgi:hypothetical protein